MPTPVIIHRAAPRLALGSTGPTSSVDCSIHKESRGNYWVPTIHVKAGTNVTWVVLGESGEPADPQPQVVLFFPEVEEPPVRSVLPVVQLNGAPGTYHYALFVHEGESFVGVDGNSPPEMIIE